MTTNQIIEQVLKTIRQYDMIASGDKVLVGISGGPDSVFLLYSLRRLQRKLNFKLSACHLDHGIRGSSSRADARFTAKLCDAMGIPVAQKKAKGIAGKRSKLSLEERARKARYEFFEYAAGKTRANVVATGHNLDDQAETVLMRIIQGASAKGASGIPPVRTMGGFRIVRPLIELEKKHITSCLRKERIAYRVDESNYSTKYLRNSVRRKIIPYLQKYNPRLKRALFNFAQHIREDRDSIESIKNGVLKRLVSKKGRFIEVPVKEILRQPPSIQREIVRDALERAGGRIKALTYRHWKEAECLIKKKNTGSSIELPGGIRSIRTSSTIRYQRIPRRKRS
ncbi:MAG: tRNA lysidine(34) synthetase TilS [Candidatus Omnitrophota bacterium]